MSEKQPISSRQIVAARAIGVPWKVLMAITGYGRTQLWKTYQAALSSVKSESEHFFDPPKKMFTEHLEGGNPPADTLLTGDTPSLPVLPSRRRIVM